MEAKHTQGEWKILGDLYTVSDDDGCPIAITALGMRDADECLANAKLIAAAPDLLAALQEVFVIGDRLVNDVYGYEFVTTARAAIAKATGAA